MPEKDNALLVSELIKYEILIIYIKRIKNKAYIIL